MSHIAALEKMAHVFTDSYQQVKVDADLYLRDAQKSTNELADEKSFQAWVILISRVASGAINIGGGPLGFEKEAVSAFAQLVTGVADGYLKFRDRVDVILNSTIQDLRRELGRSDQGNQSCHQQQLRAVESASRVMESAGRLLAH